MAIEYFLNKKSAVCVLSLKGGLEEGDAAALEECAAAVSVAGEFRYVIVSMAGVQSCAPDADRGFTMLLRGLRERATIFVCQMKSEVERDLKARGLLREEELMPDLISALTKIINLEKR